jgi:hypothetical protein
MVPTLADIEEMFFYGQADGYASGAPTTVIQELAGSKATPIINGFWSIVDCWFTHPHSIYSSGFTLISYKGKPVWTMSYQGWYEESVLWFLKESLAHNYTRKIWCGGRGPNHHVNGNLQYNNFVRESSFKLFSGKEEIYENGGGTLSDRTLRGMHMYQGMTFSDCVIR